MLVNKVAVDWVTLSMWSFELYTSLGDLRDKYVRGKFTDEKRLNYSGNRRGEWFAGEGKQAGVPHFIHQISGALANEVFDIVAHKPGSKATRLDIQVTIPYGEFKPRFLADRINALGGRVGASFIENPNGLNTCYIGSRSSERFWRVYLKEGVDGALYLRYEVELKGDVAKKAFAHYRQGKAIGQIFASEVCRLMGHIGEGMPDMYPLEKYANGEVLDTSREVSDSNRLAWLMNTVEPAVKAAHNEHGNAGFVREWLTHVVASLGGVVSWH